MEPLGQSEPRAKRPAECEVVTPRSRKKLRMDPAGADDLRQDVCPLPRAPRYPADRGSIHCPFHNVFFGDHGVWILEDSADDWGEDWDMRLRVYLLETTAYVERGAVVLLKVRSRQGVPEFAQVSLADFRSANGGSMFPTPRGPLSLLRLRLLSASSPGERAAAAAQRRASGGVRNCHLQTPEDNP